MGSQSLISHASSLDLHTNLNAKYDKEEETSQRDQQDKWRARGGFPHRTSTMYWSWSALLMPMALFFLTFSPIESAPLTRTRRSLTTCSLSLLWFKTNNLRNVHSTTYSEFKRIRFGNPDVSSANIMIENLPTDDFSHHDRITRSADDMLPEHLIHLLAFQSAFDRLVDDEFMLSAETAHESVRFEDSFNDTHTRLGHCIDCLKRIMQSRGLDISPNVTNPQFDDSACLSVISNRNLHVLERFQRYLPHLEGNVARFASEEQ